MVERTIKIGNQEVKMRSSAAIPRLYRAKFKRDIFKDLTKLKDAYDRRKDKKSDEFEVDDLEIFENVAYIMALHGDPENTPKDIDSWLDQYEMFSIYDVLPEILKLWGENMETEVNAKKLRAGRKGK